ncbi:3-phytase A [Golovinomyces cichoracearum]|uniref:3-phytase A n=1 Tax=Golovinomyces cichoracearum TaxID=62708 RepID=A0A420J268_9PEZI|nr:3-phytase A [Golovinomyces cichoracearum]
MHSLLPFFLYAFFLNAKAENPHLLTDTSKISRYWGQLSPYSDNPATFFGVEYTGLPAGCQVESAQTLQRHADRFPSSWTDAEDGSSIMRFGRKVFNFTSNASSDLFTGDLEFLNTWQIQIKSEGLLTGTGAVSEFAAGVDFWNRYGRILYNASIGQLAYDPKFPNGTDRPTIVLRTTDQSRIKNSLINWALGFFGSTINKKPQYIENLSKPFEVVTIPEEKEGKWNNTLASYVSCTNTYGKPYIGTLGERLSDRYIQQYLSQATQRLQKYIPSGFNLTTLEVHVMQYLCAYETNFLGASAFCGLFTEEEWAGFENSQDIKYYYDYSYGSPVGRAHGIGYVHEMFARLNHSLITTSSTSVNSSLTDNTETFPTNQAFHADFTHDDIIISTMTALSLDFFHSPPNITQFPPDPNRGFILSQLTPFGARLITETIGCSSSNPDSRKFPRIQYTVNQDGYSASNAPYKFVRMRLNNGIIPLKNIRGGVCGDDLTGRADGMCALEDFLGIRDNITALANYQYVCFSNYTIDDPDSGKDWDGTLLP